MKRTTEDLVVPENADIVWNKVVTIPKNVRISTDPEVMYFLS